MIFKENIKKISNIRLIYFFPILIAFLLLYFFMLQLLYIQSPMLFDIGYWVGLSTNYNPLLIEPKVLNSNSYFFTHFSPIFIFLQIIYYILPLKNPSLYFASWYVLLLILPLAISIYYVFIKKNNFNEEESFNTIFFNLFIITTLLITYFTQFQEIYRYPHTEFIGIEYICTGWLIISISKSNGLNNKYSENNFSKNLSCALIIFGSLFHELIALFGIASLITINLNKIKDIRYFKRKKIRRNILKNFFNVDTNHTRTLFIITAFIFLWIIFTNIIFKSNDQSALERIYLGSDDQFLKHLSLDYYLKNLYNLLKINRICFFYLTVSYILLSISDIKKLQNLFLPSLLIIFYILISPIAREENSAAILRIHYSYPLVFTFYFVLYSIYIFFNNLTFLRIIKKSFFKLSVIFIILFSLQILRINIPFEYKILTTDYKSLDNYDFKLMKLEEREKRPLTKNGDLLLNLYKIPKNIFDLIIISNNSNKVFQDYYKNYDFNNKNKENNLTYNIIKKKNNLYLSKLKLPYDKNLIKGKTFIYKGKITKNNLIYAIFFDKSNKTWINLPINSSNENFNYEDVEINKNDIRPILTKEFSKKIYIDSIKRLNSDIKNNDLLLLSSGDFNNDGLTEIFWKKRGNDIFLKMTINDQGDISNLDYQSQSQLINNLNKFGYKEVDNDFLSLNKFPNYDNQILDTETASLFPNISQTHLIAPYLLNQNIKLKDNTFVYWTLTPEINRDYKYIYKILSQSELKKKEFIQVGEYSGIPYYLRKYYFSPK